MTKKPNRILFYAHGLCELKCNFCAKSEGLYPKVFMPMDDFKEYAQKFIDFGIKNFELTPLIGEPFLDKHIFERIEFLYNQNVNVMMFTNLLSLTKEKLLELDKYPKFRLYISVYGDNKDSYKERTGRDKFELFKEKYQLLEDHLINRNGDGFKIGEINYRFSSKGYNEITNPIHKVTFSLINSNFAEQWNDFSYDWNWNSTLIHINEDIKDNQPEQRPFKGVCKNVMDDVGIWPNGDIAICGGWFDVNKKMVIGNLKSENLDDIFSEDGLFNTILKEQKQGKYRSLCKQCTYISDNVDPFWRFNNEVK